MKKVTLGFHIALMLTLFTDLRTNAGNRNHEPEEVIERIEKKYEDLSKQSSCIKANGETVAQSIRFIRPSDNTIKDFSKLHQIAIIRHGEPDIKKTGKFSCDEANYFLKCYDSVCIIVPEKPFFEIGKKEEVKVFSSPLNRAVSTAKYLCGNDKEITVLPCFREFENKVSKVNTDAKLPIKVWTGISRVKWMLGGGKKDGIESFSEAKSRAKESAQVLNDASTGESSKVLLTAHGMMNRYIKKNLKKMGWKVVEDTGNDYFGTTILVKIDN